MLFRKKCARCARKISKEFDFCPYCGTDFRQEKMAEKEKDYGFLGKDDFIFKDEFKMPFNFNNLVNPKLFKSGLFSSVFKEVEKQLREADKEMKLPEKMQNASGISISISVNGEKPEIKVNKFGPGFQDIETEKSKEKKILKHKITAEKARKFAKLPKKEAKTEIRRLSNKVIYEVELPGVKKLEDVIINKLENSIEIKAFGKDSVYFKLIPINLPILDYKLKNEKLILELRP